MKTNDKKDTVMPTYRVPSQTARQYEEALTYFGVSRPIMQRALMDAVIRAAKEGKKLKLPIELNAC
jgi:hypothetical protein